MEAPSSRFSLQSEVADRPQNRADAWRHGGARTPALAPPARPRRLQDRHDARAGLHFLRPLFQLQNAETEPPLLLLSGELERELHCITGR
jgi:hypothetical protein